MTIKEALKGANLNQAARLFPIKIISPPDSYCLASPHSPLKNPFWLKQRACFWVRSHLVTLGLYHCRAVIVFSSTDNSPCKVCPMQWQLHRDKCYWPSEIIKSWNESQHDCSTRDSQLLVIQDKEEMVRGQLHISVWGLV
uniref:C-type lectin domain-containing protein n=1 Tax=Podarcis muralis TaxID=64176 RepID=A0A670IQU1_PODMU